MRLERIGEDSALIARIEAINVAAFPEIERISIKNFLKCRAKDSLKSRRFSRILAPWVLAARPINITRRRAKIYAWDRKIAAKLAKIVTLRVKIMMRVTTARQNSPL